MTLPIGTIVVGQRLTVSEARSARPDAPVVSHEVASAPRLRRTRRLTASALHRAAARVAPA